MVESKSTLKADWTYAYAADGNIYKRPANASGTYNTNHDSMNRIALDFPGISYANDDRGNRITQNGAGMTFSSASSNRFLDGPAEGWSLELPLR